MCATLADPDSDVTARARFYGSLPPDSVRHYIPRGSDGVAACHFIALLTDLSPGWIFDAGFGRRARR
ncbi:MAG: hypothetical protein H0U12_09740 [Thermoleophilaceae bacterium]|nr:hypothetical protein [Thermoleophilaceae bacterium]